MRWSAARYGRVGVEVIIAEVDLAIIASASASRVGLSMTDRNSFAGVGTKNLAADVCKREPLTRMSLPSVRLVAAPPQSQSSEGGSRMTL